MPKIALVDDDRNILTSVSLTLEAEGYQVATYTDGATLWHDATSVLRPISGWLYDDFAPYFQLHSRWREAILATEPSR